jgi:hypothetical protein
MIIALTKIPEKSSNIFRNFVGSRYVKIKITTINYQHAWKFSIPLYYIPCIISMGFGKIAQYITDMCMCIV